MTRHRSSDWMPPALMPHTFSATDSLTCLVGLPPRSAADAPVGLLAPCKLLMS